MPRLHCQERFCTLFITKTLIFPQRRNDSVFLAMIDFIFLHLAGGAANTIFCHWSNAFWLVANWPPLFPQWELDSGSAILDLNFLVLQCAFSHSDSYGLAHMRFLHRQKYFKNQLNFNNFGFRSVGRIKILIFSQGFSFIFDNAFFLVPPMVSNILEKWHARIYTHFTYGF